MLEKLSVLVASLVLDVRLPINLKALVSIPLVTEKSKYLKVKSSGFWRRITTSGRRYPPYMGPQQPLQVLASQTFLKGPMIRMTMFVKL